MKKDQKSMRLFKGANARNYGRTFLVWGLSVAMMSFTLPIQAENPGKGVASTNSQVVNQTRTVTGTVIDETGEPLIGVSVLVQGTTNGTITDFDGNYSLNVPANATLTVSYIGYQTQNIQVGNQSVINISLKPDNQLLDEVVVIGYGTMKKRDLTGAITSVKSEDITLNPGANPMEALQGKVAGLDITRSSGAAGEGVSIQLRGNRSFTASGDPTFIIDGMPGNYETLNPNDIESIEVLKDASSAAIYGSSGANGVILITTKNGKEGKINVDFNAYIGINGWSEIPKMRSGESYVKAIRQAQAAVGNTYSSDSDMLDAVIGEGAGALNAAGKYIDWADELLETGYTQNYSVSVSGATDKTKAYFSLNFSDEKGQFHDDDYKVYSSNMRIDHKIKNWMSVGINAQMSYVYRNRAYSSLENALISEPLGELYDEDGNLNVVPGTGTQVNLLLNNKSNYRNNQKNYKLYFNPYIELRPIKGLTIQSRLGATLAYSRSNYFQGEGSYQYYTSSGTSASGVDASVYATITQSHNYNYKWENIFTYNFQILNDHDFTVTAVTSYNHNQYDYTYQRETNIADNAYLWHNMGVNQDYVTATSSYNMSKGWGLVGRLSYSYKGRYLLSASVRRDGSSKLAKGNRWDTFPAISVGWRISDESFMEGTKNWLDNLKIRLGYGITGTASIDPYATAYTLEATTLSFSGDNKSIYRYSQNYTNKELGWEKSYNTNIGIDASFLNNRIDLTADFYLTKTKGVIWTRNLPVTAGAYTATSYYNTTLNICETENRGVELALNTRNIDTKDFKWSSTLTYSYNKEKIVKLADGTSNYVTNGDYALAIGEAINSYYHYKIDGIWKTSEAADAAVFGQEPGDIKIDVSNNLTHTGTGEYTDADGNVYTAENTYAISANDYKILGHNSPDWTLGFQNTFTYKNFDLSIYMYMRWGQMIQYDLLGSYDPSGVGNFPKYFKYWTEDNQNANFPAINGNNDITSYTGYYALQYVDGSFFKIKNITLGYTLPKSVLTKAGISKCRFYATITNPLVLAHSSLLKDYDPEMNGSLSYPLTKQLVFGVNLSF